MQKVHYYYSAKQKAKIKEGGKQPKYTTVTINGKTVEYTEMQFDEEDLWRGKKKPDPLGKLKPHAERFDDSQYLGYTVI